MDLDEFHTFRHTPEELAELRKINAPILTREDFLNAKLRAETHPDLFQVPTLKDIAALKEKDYVLLECLVRLADDNVFLLHVDKVWVQLEGPGRIKGCVARFTGTVSSDVSPEFNEALTGSHDAGLEYGDVVDFSHENILDFTLCN